MALPVNSIVEVSWEGSCLNQRTLTVRHLKVVQPATGNPPVQTEMQQLLDFVFGAAGSNLAVVYTTMCASNFTLLNGRVQPVAATRFRPTIAPYNLPGQREAAATTLNIHGSIVYRTDLAGRNQIGVVKPPALSPTDYSGGLVLAGWSLPAANFAALTVGSFLVTASGGIYQWVLWRRDPVTPLISQNVTGWSISDRVGTIRRRTLRVGI